MRFASCATHLNQFMVEALLEEKKSRATIVNGVTLTVYEVSNSENYVCKCGKPAKWFSRPAQLRDLNFRKDL